MPNFTRILFLPLALFILFTGCHKNSRHSYAIKKIVISEGDTLTETLEALELPSKAREEIVGSLSSIFNPKYSRPGDYYQISIDTALDPSWRTFTYFPGGQEYYSLVKSTSGVEAAKAEFPAKKEVIKARGKITSTLWEAMTSQRVEPDLIMDFADIFASQIDFLTEPRAGDTFKIIYEEAVLPGGKAVHKQIIAAQFTASGREYTALLYTNPDGSKGYYAPDGKSMASAFLRAPLQYRRISSYFSRNRYHPIFKTYRPHLGIDYAAPQGTPVSSIGNGTVLYSGWKGGNGIFIQIKHPNGYISYYSHLSRIAKNIHPGARVKRGQLIGYVGMTGIATGPHLDFRVKKGGVFLNYLKLKIPPETSIKGSEKERFAAMKKEVFRQFAELNY